MTRPAPLPSNLADLVALIIAWLTEALAAWKAASAETAGGVASHGVAASADDLDAGGSGRVAGEDRTPGTARADSVRAEFAASRAVGAAASPEAGYADVGSGSDREARGGDTRDWSAPAEGARKGHVRRLDRALPAVQIFSRDSAQRIRASILLRYRNE